MQAADAIARLADINDEIDSLKFQEQKVAELRREAIKAFTAEHEQVRRDQGVLASERRQLILELTRNHGWTQTQVAELLQISGARVSYIINGRTPQKRGR